MTGAAPGPLVAFALTDVLVCLTPGPAVLCVVTQALGHGPRRALWANAGVLAADACYVALAGLGVGALLAAAPTLLRAVQYAGAAYLAGVGVATWRGRGTSAQVGPPPAPGAVGAAGVAKPRTRMAGSAALARGFATQAANPKALLFFTALLPQFVRAGAPLGPQVIVLGGLAAAIEGAVLLGYAALAGRAAPALGRPRVARAVDRASRGPSTARPADCSSRRVFGPRSARPDRPGDRAARHPARLRWWLAGARVDAVQPGRTGCLSKARVRWFSNAPTESSHRKRAGEF